MRRDSVLGLINEKGKMESSGQKEEDSTLYFERHFTFLYFSNRNGSNVTLFYMQTVIHIPLRPHLGENEDIIHSTLFSFFPLNSTIIGCVLSNSIPCIKVMSAIVPHSMAHES